MSKNHEAENLETGDEDLFADADESPPRDDDVEIIIDEDGEEEEAPVEAAAEEEEAPAEDAVGEEEAPAEEAAGEETDAELESMPQKFRKRFERETRLRNEIIAERDQFKDAAIKVVQRAKAIETEAQTLRTQNHALQKQFAETLDYAYGQDIVLKSQELRKAREDGEYDKEMTLQSELDTLRFQQNQVRQAKAALPAAPAAAPAAPTAPQGQAQEPAAPAKRPPPAPLAVKWVEANKAWFNSPKFAGHRAFTLAEDSRLVAEGYDKMTPEYYAELDRRVNEAFPTLRKKPAAAKTSSSPVAPVGNSAAQSQSRKTIRLTRSDLQNMQRFGLDPQNKDHLREFARNKAA